MTFDRVYLAYSIDGEDQVDEAAFDTYQAALGWMSEQLGTLTVVIIKHRSVTDVNGELLSSHSRLMTKRGRLSKRWLNYYQDIGDED